jgi:hypothetical protein
MNNSSNTNNTEKKNVLVGFKNPSILYPFSGIILIIIIALFLIIYKVPLPTNINSPNKSEQTIIADIFIILSFILLVFLSCIMFLPNFKEIKQLFQQIHNVSYVVIYTISLILLLSLLPNDTINNYAYIITPLTIILGIIFFYIGSTTDYTNEFNISYERIKSIILLLCLISIIIIYYVTDQGGYFSKYFGYSLLLTSIIAIFAFLYLMVVVSLPNTMSSSKSGNLLNNFSNFSVYGSILFLIFLSVITYVISTYPGGFFTDKVMSSSSLILLLIICILWLTLLCGNLFSDVYDKQMNLNKMNLFKSSLLFLFGLVISGLLIFWIVYNIQSLSGQSSIVSLILNILIIVIILSLIYKTINVKLPSGNAKKDGFFNLLLNIIFYIPCIFSDTFEKIMKFFIGEYNATNYSSIIMLLISIILIIIYFIYPTVFKKFNIQGGKQLVNQPVYTDSQYSLGTYEQLNGTTEYDYQYALSSWIFIDSSPPNTNSSYGKYTSLLNFANKPNILYNAKNNTLMITMEQKDLQKNTKNKLTDYDDRGNRILFIKENILLQKWNNIIINYNGGVLDIFLNGELVKSDINVVPYYTLDNLTIGENIGIKGGICNVVYFRHALNSSNIYYLYHMNKNKTPPVANESNDTIIKL